jgi:hypothetical protein
MKSAALWACAAAWTMSVFSIRRRLSHSACRLLPNKGHCATFDRRRLYPRIRTILERFQSSERTRLTGVEKQFMNHFRSLQLQTTPSLTERSDSSNQMMFGFFTQKFDIP